MVVVINAHSCYFITYNIAPLFYPIAKDLGFNIYEENEDLLRTTELV